MNMLVSLIVSICLLALVLLCVFSVSYMLLYVGIILIPILFFLLNRKPVNDFLNIYNRDKIANFNICHKTLISFFQSVYRAIAIVSWSPVVILLLYLLTNNVLFGAVGAFSFLCIAILCILQTVLIALIYLIDRVESFGGLFFVDLIVLVSWAISYLAFQSMMYAI